MKAENLGTTERRLALAQRLDPFLTWLGFRVPWAGATLYAFWWDVLLFGPRTGFLMLRNTVKEGLW